MAVRCRYRQDVCDCGYCHDVTLFKVQVVKIYCWVLNDPGTSMIAATLRQSTTVQSMLKVVLHLAVLLVSFDHNDVTSYLTTD
ncbi:hypothetical protein BO79DRAFT_160869 [Aspergillus costaricaensis CBS 115574]|uniref:Uncharacterized protein n=1 Tax=Aspergillus costaricaensis CBS 115574 TaxID=1448317 RepID=A0ACD1HYS6_9EURO|nr:hypothetical protein BO79DRAFT_160869 [Aspergillus costaricaensis CBS 115574]RAK83445.1 hypothetical protein BO79DRAFT_160869 [Aspergillus costaricaensis CBS 115574]